MPDSQQIDIPGVGIVEFPSSMSDADIALAASRLHLAAANAIPLSEPTTYEAGRNKSLVDTASKTGEGFLRGINPFSNLSQAADRQRQWMDPQQPMPSRPGIAEQLKSLSDPSTGGEALGGLTLGLAGSMAPRAPVRGTLRMVGKGLQTYDITKPAKPIGDVLQWAGTPKPPVNPALPLAEPIGGVSRAVIPESRALGYTPNQAQPPPEVLPLASPTGAARGASSIPTRALGYTPNQAQPSPVIPLAEGGPSAAIVHGPEQFRVPYSTPAPPTPNAVPVKLPDGTWTYADRSTRELLPQGATANVISKRGKTWTATVPSPPPLSLSDEIQAAIMKRLSGK